MKRFYCTICKKIKRVRSYPRSVATPDAHSPNMRVGACSRHSFIQTKSLKKAVNS